MFCVDAKHKERHIFSPYRIKSFRCVCATFVTPIEEQRSFRNRICFRPQAKDLWSTQWLGQSEIKRTLLPVDRNKSPFRYIFFLKKLPVDVQNPGIKIF
jgi:hypothetical protein